MERVVPWSCESGADKKMFVASELPDVIGPTELNTGNHGPGLEIGKDKLSIRYVGEGRHGNDVGSIQASKPVPTQQLLYYFEVTVVSQGELGRIGLGFTDKNFKVTRQPG
eukprot:GHRR01011438.1.p1 GENE.GHRR01011438.1~~GHRR01011438.1.p1  ORF type:complete len:110 (+),score=15.22 GHRR01011438.1:182-511(+)